MSPLLRRLTRLPDLLRAGLLLHDAQIRSNHTDYTIFQGNQAFWDVHGLFLKRWEHAAVASSICALC